jgi:putative secretion ATPase (PEP-CTERM system associated)
VYERYFQLRERPFALSPDPDYLYPSKVHSEALSYLRYGVEGHAGFVVITGEIGSGKTTMLQSLLGRLDRNTTVARIVNTMLDARELLDAIVLDFGIDPTGMSKPVLLHRLAEFLVAQRQAGRLTLLVIDEAQNLSLPALEEIRMLSNLETEKSKLIQIIMIGQPELREKLSLPHLQQLRQRITVSYHLTPLDADETAAYMNHRLRRAAVGPPVEFPRDVTDLIHQRSRGVPRIINVIADATLLFAYGVDRRDIDIGISQEALTELDATGVLASYQSEGTQAAVATSVSVAEAQEAIRIADEVRRREQALAARERQLAQREQQVAAQQRVVEEEARILAAARTAKTEAANAAAAAVGAPLAAAASVAATSVAATSVAAGSPSRPVAPTSGTIAPAKSEGAPAQRSGIAPTGSKITPPGSTGASPTREAAPAPRSTVTPTTSSKVAPTASKVAAPGITPAPTTRHRSVFGPTGNRMAAAGGLSVTPSGVRVQRYQHTLSSQEGRGWWERLRRVLFGLTEPDETGA